MIRCACPLFLCCMLSLLASPVDADPVRIVGWASSDEAGNNITIDAVLPAGEREKLWQLVAELKAQDDTQQVPAKHPKLPGTIRIGQPLTVVTPQGQVAVAVTGYSVYSSEGNSHFLLDARGAGKGKVQGVAVSGPLAQGAKLVPPIRQPLPAELARSLAGKLEGQLTPEVRQELGARHLEAAHLHVLSTRQPVGHRIVLLDRPLTPLAPVKPTEEENQEMQWTISGLFDLDQQGAITQVVQELTNRLVGYGVQWVVDLEGDGRDELIVQQEYPIGATEYLLIRWDGKKYEEIQLHID